MKALMHNVDRGSGGAVFSSWRRLAFQKKHRAYGARTHSTWIPSSAKQKH